MAPPGEFEIIARYFTGHDRRADVLLGIGDDAAVLDLRADRKLVVAMDSVVEGVHFPAGTDAADIGYRALAVNLSDLAAMGAEPAWMTLSLSMPRAEERWLEAFASGLFELAHRYDVALVGGDTVRGPLVITVQVGGWVEPDRWLTRSGARPGDVIMISGIPGEAAAGLAVVQQKIPDGEAATLLRERFLRPQPRVELGRRLRTIATAAMDVSDGLVTDLRKLCAASRCAAELKLDWLPDSPAAAQLFDSETRLRQVLAGGDDYELLFTASPESAAELLSRSDVGLPITRIGVITSGEGVRCTREGRSYELGSGGYEHFAGGS